MKEIFVDTSAWDAIEDAKDANHEIALLFKEEIAGKCRLVTTSYVLDETYTLLLLNIGYTRTVKFKRNIDVMTESGILIVAHISRAIEKEAWEVFEKFNVDKEWSFTWRQVGWYKVQMSPNLSGYLRNILGLDTQKLRHLAQLRFILL